MASERAFQAATAFFETCPPPDARWYVEGALIPILAEHITVAITEAIAAEREACAHFIDLIADDLDKRAAAAIDSDIVHGILTDHACALQNIAAAIRQRASVASPESPGGSPGG